MREIATNINGTIGSLDFDLPALKARFDEIGKPVEPKFIDAMRTTLVQHAKKYSNDLLTPRKVYRSTAEDIERRPDSPAKAALLLLKQLADNNRADLAATRKAFELLGQNKAVLALERTVASNHIMQDLWSK
jgi:hypothetical protein